MCHSFIRHIWFANWAVNWRINANCMCQIWRNFLTHSHMTHHKYVPCIVWTQLQRIAKYWISFPIFMTSTSIFYEYNSHLLCLMYQKPTILEMSSMYSAHKDEHQKHTNTLIYTLLVRHRPRSKQTIHWPFKPVHAIDDNM